MTESLYQPAETQETDNCFHIIYRIICAHDHKEQRCMTSPRYALKTKNSQQILKHGKIVIYQQFLEYNRISHGTHVVRQCVAVW